MSFLDVVFISIGLASDAFAVAICKGMIIKNNKIKKFIILSVTFALAQVLMPLLGYNLGNAMSFILNKVNYLFSFAILTIIGFNLIYDAYINKENDVLDVFSFWELFLSAIVTSIDALVVGFTFSIYKTNLLLVLCTIGIITFLMSLLGVCIGYWFGKRFENKSKLIGGLLLIVMGIRFLFK